MINFRRYIGVVSILHIFHACTHTYFYIRVISFR